ncbi:type 1 fimbrial major subunit FimA [Serratia liquefaciens]|uniref:Type-1 fimbrial protein subunit A n=1 Tax=Serratia liquefaciens TaxID=614 RepID=A0A515D5Y6_SERLI|nr:type-1 fimbrial protein subunit A [Serratia liquefaciens]
MKKITLLIISTLSISSATALADDTVAPVIVNGGKVHFKGEVVNSACAIDAGSVDQTIQLGQVRTSKLNTAGSTSTSVGFNIQLNDCDISIAKKASVAFVGTAVDASNPTVLALQNSTAGGASNVGVQILDNRSSPLALDGSAFGAPITLNNGTNTIPFQARYYATGAATPGIANADATFKVQYE